jgi:hypothetical protein
MERSLPIVISAGIQPESLLSPNATATLPASASPTSGGFLIRPGSPTRMELLNRNTIFISYDYRSEQEKIAALKKKLLRTGKVIFEHDVRENSCIINFFK